jgi:hypothetical protein
MKNDLLFSDNQIFLWDNLTEFPFQDLLIDIIALGEFID